MPGPKRPQPPPRPETTQNYSAMIHAELRAIKMALWTIALKMTTPADLPPAVSARIAAATEKLTASTDFLADAVAEAEASIPGATT